MKLIYMKQTLDYIQTSAREGNVIAISKVAEINNYEYDSIPKDKYIVFNVN